MRLRYGTPEEAGMCAQRVRHVAALAEQWVAQGATPALVVLAARRGIIVLHEAFGRLTPEPDSPPLQRDTIFPLQSITKPITATAIMMLVEDGLVSLNRPVSEYIPEFVGEGKGAVMVHHLLTHTSGLRVEELNAHAERKREIVPIPPHEETQHPRVHENLFLRYDAPLGKAPGAEMSYVTYNYALLGEILRRVSGRSLTDFARERIFDPLGMEDTHLFARDALRHRIVRRLPDAPHADWIESNERLAIPGAGGGAYSTAMDMAVFGQMFLNRGRYGDARILSPASVAAMTRNQIPGIGARYGEEVFPEASWGLGWSIRGEKKSVEAATLLSPQCFHHGGAGGVFMWGDPVYEMVGVYFSVVLKLRSDGSMERNPDLFANAVTAAIIDA